MSHAQCLWHRIVCIRNTVAIIIVIGKHTQLSASLITLVRPTVTVKIDAAAESNKRIGIGEIRYPISIVIEIAIVS